MTEKREKPFRFDPHKQLMEFVKLGCGCIILGEHYPPQYCAKQFYSVCEKHEPVATTSSPYCKLGKLMRVQGERNIWANRWYHPNGDPVTQEERNVDHFFNRWKYWLEAAPEREAAAKKKAEDEAFLLEHGWTKEGEDSWTAPEELKRERYRLLGKKPKRYTNTKLGHAVNTQRLVLREGYGGGLSVEDAQLDRDDWRRV